MHIALFFLLIVDRVSVCVSTVKFHHSTRSMLNVRVLSAKRTPRLQTLLRAARSLPTATMLLQSLDSEYVKFQVSEAGSAG